ncbi:extra macrochaetae-like protein [Penaeus vannamei]|uniref:Extra macrochaetae-like protein n=1 Tax=Penaeus vannamei TaxID=6689 RepID=A0A423SU18_PENVA|nr:extra macrochaetae-like protein [Penaeus vannamei]
MNCLNNGAMAAMAAALSAKSSVGSDKTQMHLYLDRLKAMVPQCPKNRKVSRQELIEHVIDYISDLQDTLQSRLRQPSRKSHGRRQLQRLLRPAASVRRIRPPTSPVLRSFHRKLSLSTAG